MLISTLYCLFYLFPASTESNDPGHDVQPRYESRASSTGGLNATTSDSAPAATTMNAAFSSGGGSNYNNLIANSTGGGVGGSKSANGGYYSSVATTDSGYQGTVHGRKQG